MVQLFIQNIEVKLYESKDEQIVVNRKLKDYRNIEKIFGDYSESFTVPANANNEIFKHYYDADVVDGFDARVKQPAYILFDGQLWKRGSVQLKNIEIKDNRPSSYTVQFFAEITQLVDLFGEDLLSDLDYSAFEHDYTYANVKTGLTTGLFSGDLIYPLISYDRRFLYNTSTAGLDGEEATDISQSGSADNQGLLWLELKPALKIKAIFDVIQADYSLTFQGDIFNDVAFTEIYMNLINVENDLETTSDFPITEVVMLGFTPDVHAFSYTVTPDAGFTTVEYRVLLKYNNTIVYDSGLVSGSNGAIHSFIQSNPNFSVSVEVQSNEPFDYQVNAFLDVQEVGTSTAINQFNRTETGRSINPTVNVGLQFQEFKVVDFIKAFVKAFNLVVIPIDETTIFFQPLQDWYAEGKIVDITKYVNTEKLRVSPGKLIAGLEMGYDKYDTFLSAVFKENNARGFGELDIDFEDSNNNDLIGETLEVKLPFEKPVFEKIASEVVYGFFVNRQQEQFNPFHSIFYVRSMGNPIYLKQEDNTTEVINTFYNPVTSQQPGTNLALNFETELDEYTLTDNDYNFYTAYYSDYVSDLFSSRRRQYNLEAKLPKHIVLQLALNDRLLIGQRRYLINSFQQNLNTDVIKFELLNDIFDGAESVGQAIALKRSAVVFESSGGKVTIGSVGGFDISTTGTPPTWYSVTISGKQITIDVDENTSGSTRQDLLDVRFSDPSITTVQLKVYQND